MLDERKVCQTYNYKNDNSVEQYNLEMITALAFRVKSRNMEVFREWLMRKDALVDSDRYVVVSQQDNVLISAETDRPCHDRLDALQNGVIRIT